MNGILFLSVWRLWLFWLIFFAAFRTGFILAQPTMWPDGHLVDPLRALAYAGPLDLSMAGYLMLIPVLIRYIGLMFNKEAFIYFKKCINIFNIILIVVLTGIFGANIFLYPEWNTLLNYRAFQYLKDPAALFDSISPLFMVGSLALYAALVWVFWRLYRWIVRDDWYPALVSRWGVFSLPLHAALLILAIRGGLGVMAINESAVYYSSHLFSNHAATNTLWHLIHSVLETKTAKHRYEYLWEKEAFEAIEGMLPLTSKPDTAQHPSLLKSLPGGQQPNVVIIVMESMTAQVIEYLGGTPEICPNLAQLSRSGIRFDSCYSSGFRTDQGIVAILSGYPAQPDQSIILLTEKSEKLPGLPGILRKEGYSTAFYYGGGLTFANMGLWLRSQGFETVVSESDFPSSEITQRWGADDKQMLQRFYNGLNQLKPPFFATALTLSLHPPFDVPHQSRWSGSSDAEKFRHSAHFADEAIGNFMAAAQKTDWYTNTLFVFVADHGALLPNEIAGDDPGAKHIPWIITGAPLSDAVRGRNIRSLCNHHDIPATLLGLLHVDNRYPVQTLFPWSRDVLNAQKPAKAFAYYANENGLGWLEGKNAGFYNFTAKQWRSSGDSLSTEAQTRAKAYLQMLYSDFLQR